MKQPLAPKIFDSAKLESMSEPLSIRVEKLKGNTRTPIPLPASDDGTPQGTNWSRDDVRGLEAWLVTDWSGGGMYAITVTDSSLPTALKHDWTIFYNPADYPEKVPPTLSSAVSPERASAPQQQSQQVRLMGHYPSAFPNGLPNGPAAPQVGQPTTYYAPQPQQPIQYIQQPAAPRELPVSTSIAATAAAAADADRRRLEDQLKEVQLQLARAREEQMQVQHRQELERAEARMRTEQAAQFDSIKQVLAQLAAANARPAVDPALEQLREQNRMLAAQAEDARREHESERREREAERREREMKDLIQRQQEDTRRQMEMMQAQLVASQQNKSDPMLMFMQESSRQQVEAVKEQARNQTAQMAQLQTYMMNPRDIMAMAKESSNGLDQATRSITSTYQSILEMQRNAVEQILQLNQGGGNETIQLIEKGLERASSFAERFIGGKTKEAVSTQQSQAQLATANATAMQAQAQALTVQAQMQAAARQAAAAAPATPVAPDAGLSGPRIPTPITGSNGAVAAKPAWTTGPVPAMAGSVAVRRILGHTDEEWFGPILPKVNELRDGVGHFIESLTQTPHRLNKDGTVEGVEPEQAATVIMQAAMIVMEQQIPIAAMIDLLGQGRIADFMDVLLPDAPQPYRDEVAQMLMKELSGNSDEEEEEEEEEEEDEGEDEGEEQVAAPVSPTKNAKPAPRARA